MKKFFLPLLFAIPATSLLAEDIQVYSPDSLLKVTIIQQAGSPFYTVTYKEKTMLEQSPLGLVTDMTDFSQGVTLKRGNLTQVEDCYSLSTIKTSHVHYLANQQTCTLTTVRCKWSSRSATTTLLSNTS